MSFRHRSLILLLFAVLFSLVQPAAAQNPSPPAYNPVNGHWYQEFRTGGLTFQQARAAAAGHSYAGYPGHLVTVTSPDEHQFLLTHVIRQGGEHWIGLFQDRSALDYREPDGGWRWITGEPYFWNHWNGEPNNAHGNEDVAVMRGTTGWNDLSHTDQQYGYIVEYEPQSFPGGVSDVRIALSPNPVVGGQGVAGQLTLSQPAGMGGVVVTLASSNPAAAVTPASVTVPSGAFTVSFPVITFPVAQATSVTISAVCLGIHSSATLQVLPREGGPPMPPGHVGSTPIYNPGNGHWYQMVRVTGTTWHDARSAARSLSYAGLTGHLVTVTSAAEEQFIVSRVLDASGDNEWWWLGGYQDTTAPDYREPAGGWRWVTGEPWGYTDWRFNQPDNAGGIEHFLGFFLEKKWNDFATTNSSNRGYIVEYELSPGVPPVPPFGNRLVNGSFEEPKGSPHGLRNLPGWRMTRGTVDILTEPGWQAAHGQQMLDLVGTPGAATIEQSFATDPGIEYLFSGWISRNPEVSEGRANVYLNGQFFVQLFHREPGVIHRNMRWVPFAYRFRAVAPVTTLTLEDVTNLWDAGGGIFLDGLSVTAGDEQGPPPGPPPGDPGSAPVYNPANGHWYQLVRTPGELNWPDARASAESLSFAGYRGHLATITSAAERDFINTQVTGKTDLYAVWLGGYQDPGAPDYQEPDRGWRWVTGEPFQYTNWHRGEPNDSPRHSNALQLAVIWGGEWDDRLNGEARLPGYIVEYESAGTPPSALAAPTNLTVTVVSKDQVNLAWTDNSHNETGFAVYRREGSGPWARIALLGPNVTRYADLDVRSGIAYAYRVQAVRDGEVSAWSNEASTAPPPPPPPPPSLVPAAPSNLTARAVSHLRVDLAWKDNSHNETAFALWRKGGGPLTQSAPAASSEDGWERIAVLPPNQTTFSDRSVEPETAYVYRVRAIGKEGASDWSNEARVTTPFDNGEPQPAGPPATPAGFKAQVISALEVRLSWARYIPGASGIGIWRRTGSGAWEKVGGPPTHNLTYQDESVKPKTTYTYRARAHSDRGVSEWTNEVTVTTPPLTPVPVEQQRLSAPSDLVAQATGPNAVLLTWQDNSSDETAFTIFRRLGTGPQQRVGEAPPNTTRFTDTTALPGRRYYYQIWAHHNSAVSYRSSEATVVTPSQ